MSRTVAVALVANIGVAIAKVAAVVLTGSTAMMAEAAHAVADVGNQLLLVVAQHRSVRPADARHPFGYGREAYFWALLASVVVFVAGAVFSFREGIAELLHPVPLESFTVVYLVLGVSVVLDATSLIQSVRELRREGRAQRRDFLDQLMLTSDPTVRAVFAEDAAAIAGDLVAFVGIVLHHLSGSSSPEGWAATIIGVILVGVGLQLARRNRDFLLGEQAPPAAKERIYATIAAFPGVSAVDQLLVTFIGPRQVWVLCRVDIAPTLTGDQVESLVKNLDRSLREQSAYVYRVDIVPIGRTGPEQRGYGSKQQAQHTSRPDPAATSAGIERSGVGMGMETRLTKVLGEFARTLASDFSIQAILDQLVVRIVDVLRVSAAGVSLIVRGEDPRYVAASDARGLRFERLQSDLGVGPCLEAYATGAPVLVDDLRADERFGAFRLRAIEEGLIAVFAFPLCHGTTCFGALDVYRTSAGPLDSESMEAAQTLADVTASYLVMARARADLERSGEALLQSQGLTAAILHSALDAIISIDSRGMLTSSNPAAQRLFGFDAHDVLSLGVADLIAPDDRCLAKLSGPDGFLDGGQAPMIGQRIDLVAQRADGGRFPAELTISLNEAAGEPSFTAFVRDLTERNDDRAERERLEARLQQAHRMESLGQLAGGVAHDFNNLLMVIMSYAGFITDEPGDVAAVTASSAAITTAAQRAAQLIHQLLTFARREPVQRMPLDVNEVVERVHGLLVDVIGDHVRIVIDPAAGLPAVNLDRGQSEQLLVNLAVNARDAMPTGGTLTIRTALVSSPVWLSDPVAGIGSDRWVELSVGDDGMGMSPAVAAQAFEPFFTTKAVGDGSGLGLATVYAIVAESGGTVSLESTEGSGTVVTMRFPIVEGGVGQPAPTGDEAVVPGEGQTILVVEDQPLVLVVTVAMLRRNGYNVLETGDVDDAMSLASRHRFDLLLTDVVMPKYSGRTLAERLRVRTPELRVLYMSGYSEDVFGSHGGLEPGVVLLRKPFDEPTLLRAVHVALAK